MAILASLALFVAVSSRIGSRRVAIKANGTDEGGRSRKVLTILVIWPAVKARPA